MYHPAIPNATTWSKLGKHGEHGEHQIDKHATNHHHSQLYQLPNSQTSNSSSSGYELERNQKKENHLNKISKMIGTLVHVQLYTFSYRKAVIQPQNMPNSQMGVKSGYFQMAPQVQPKCFWQEQHMIKN